MNTFPSFQSSGAAQRSRIDSTGREDFSFYHLVQGTDPNLRPAGLRAADWFIAVNPTGYDDPENEDFNLKEDFEGHNVDATFVLAQGEIEEIKQSLWQTASDNAEGAYTDDSGTLFAVWQLAD